MWKMCLYNHIEEKTFELFPYLKQIFIYPQTQGINVFHIFFIKQILKFFNRRLRRGWRAAHTAMILG